jgi:hypothetical protein
MDNKNPLNLSENYVYKKASGAVALKKWSLIIDALNVTDDKIRQFIADYCEHSCDQSSKISFNNIEEVCKHQDMFPLSIKILSMLNLKDKNLFLVEEQPKKDLTVTLDDAESNMVKEWIVSFLLKQNEADDIKNKTGIDIVQHSEKLLMNELVNMINKELETKDNFYVSKMVDSYSYVNDGTGPKMILTSRCSVE